MFREELDSTGGMFEIQFVGMQSCAFHLGKGVGLLRPRSLVTRLINVSRGTTTTTMRSRGLEREKDFIWHQVQMKDFILRGDARKSGTIGTLREHGVSHGATKTALGLR